MNFIKIIKNFILSIFHNRELIISLSKREVAAQYRGSLLGFVWTIITPLIMITIFWFIFSVGFKSQPMNDVPFVIWLTAGLSIWSFFSESIQSSTEVLIHNAQLIKKTLFQPQILPIVKILSSLFNHFIFLSILILLIVIQGLPISFYFLQSIYYLFCTAVLAISISWITSSLTVFIRDISKITAIILQVGFWATPIFWDIGIMDSEKIQQILKLNPMFYIVQGYRDSFIYSTPISAHIEETIIFWSITLILLIFGGFLFNKLKPHFADVL